MICDKSSHIRLFICAGWSEQSLWWWHTVATWPGYPQSIQVRLIRISLRACHMFPRGHFLMKWPVKATCPDNNLFQRIKALLSCYLSVSYRHTCACIQWSYSVDVLYTKQKKKSINLIISVFLCNDLITRQQLYMARSPQPAARNLQPATRSPQNSQFAIVFTIWVAFLFTKSVKVRIQYVRTSKDLRTDKAWWIQIV